MQYFNIILDNLVLRNIPVKYLRKDKNYKIFHKFVWNYTVQKKLLSKITTTEFSYNLPNRKFLQFYKWNIPGKFL